MKIKIKLFIVNQTIPINRSGMRTYFPISTNGITFVYFFFFFTFTVAFDFVFFLAISALQTFPKPSI